MKNNRAYGFSIDGRLRSTAHLGKLTEQLANYMLRSSTGETDLETKRRLALLAFISLTGSLTLLFFGILSYFQGNKTLGIFDLLMAALLLLNLRDSSKRGKYQLNITLAVSLVSFFYAYLYISGGFNQTAFVWYYTYPLIASFLLGSKNGAIGAGLMLIPVVLILLINPSHPFFATYNLDFEIRFIVSYSVVSLFSFFIENASEHNRKDIYTINTNLESLISERTKELTTEFRRHKEAKTQLKESEKRHRIMFEKAVNAIFLVDKETGQYLDANPAAEELTGRSKKEILGLTTADITPDLAESRLKNLSHRSSSLEKISITYIRPDGSSRSAMLNAISLTDTLAMGIAQDVTDQIEAEKERSKLEARLNQAQKMEAIGNLAGGIAHDFNNILSSVLGFTDLALDDAEDGSPQQENLEEVYAAGLRAKDLVAQILAFARQSEASTTPVRISTLIQEVLKLVRASIPSTIEIRQTINSNSVIMANEIQLHQVIMNLCTNAAHAMRDKGGVLGIELRETSKNEELDWLDLGVNKGIYAIMTISDTGNGIDPSIINSIFEPYFTTKKIGEGTGMGLAMVKGIVESTGGAISVESIPAQSTIFTIYLPVTTSRENNNLHEKVDIPEGSERILLVDDEPPITKMGAQLLTNLGYTVTFRTSSFEALKLFQNKADDFDLVITDMTMPHMTGTELAAQLMEIRPDIPVILCSGYSNKISIDAAKHIGIKEFVYKPFTKAELSKKIHLALGKVSN